MSILILQMSDDRLEPNSQVEGGGMAEDGVPYDPSFQSCEKYKDEENTDFVHKIKPEDLDQIGLLTCLSLHINYPPY